ncbi:hypothetical protein N5J43_05600 [Pseudomonas nicosulfuronedens]|uniref:Uncharacterized protein n=1 Tax=Pseudomonas nicosulfuronedens TaxID=2571105 RepID=A0A5R9RBX0_9PSED|nr:hypothetical protein [Pseudomonas nicosulfuronedens]MDH1007884.1 hypothetical protein [Pseudomonas nicosulfuronedens]MDH1978414.1 hypothetical protein [Pseudomonas nicosulfuronedens]MDH2024995.1 hypothetical protein [Pseudomonas nicosulfuronedens]TLX80761.1 hypothetical protein FAS41_03700 [Pseudomonas nicosulfuronedens]
MTLATGLPESLVEFLRQSVNAPQDRVEAQDFVRRSDVRELYRDTLGTPRADEMLAQCAVLFPELNLNRASLLALFCGSWVEGGASPRIAFAAVLDALGRALAVLRPYCADEEAEDDEDAQAAARQARARLDSLTPSQSLLIDSAHAAVDLLVLPLMTMLMRSRDNHRDFLANGELLLAIDAMVKSNTTLPFENLHFLDHAAALTYEDELVVILPATRTGLVVSAQGINCNFHAFSLLQPLLAAHGKRLGLQVSAPVSATEVPREDRAQYLWLQAFAYEKGELVNNLAWAWGEAPLRSNSRKHGHCVLIALDTEEGVSRSWSGFADRLHDAHQPSVELVRFLSEDEVVAYLA